MTGTVNRYRQDWNRVFSYVSLSASLSPSTSKLSCGVFSTFNVLLIDSVADRLCPSVKRLSLGSGR